MISVDYFHSSVAMTAVTVSRILRILSATIFIGELISVHHDNIHALLRGWSGLLYVGLYTDVYAVLLFISSLLFRHVPIIGRMHVRTV